MDNHIKIEYLIYSKDNLTTWILILDNKQVSLKYIFDKSITFTQNFLENKFYQNNTSCTSNFNVIY